MNRFHAYHPAASPCNRRTALYLGSGGLVAALALTGTRATQAQERSALDANKALVYRVFEEAVNGGEVVVISEVYATAFVDSTRAARRLPRLAGMPIALHAFRTLFPEIVATVEAMIAEGDLVATRVAWQREPSPGANPVEGHTMHLSRIANGRISEEWSVGWDWLDPYLTGSSPHSNPLLTR